MMKSERITIMITEEMVSRYEKLFGKQKKLSPSFPMIFYQYFQSPWKFEAPPIHRKQRCVTSEELIMGNSYECELSLDKKVRKGANIFYTQSLVGYNKNGKESFQCVSELVVQLR